MQAGSSWKMTSPASISLAATMNLPTTGSLPSADKGVQTRIKNTFGVTNFFQVRSPSECTEMIPGDFVEDVRAMVCGRRLVVVSKPLVGGGGLRERSVSTHHSHSSHNLLTQHENILEMTEPHFCTYCMYILLSSRLHVDLDAASIFHRIH